MAKHDEQDIPTYTPLPWSLAEIRASIPPELFRHDTSKALSFLGRDILLALFVWRVTQIGLTELDHMNTRDPSAMVVSTVLRGVIWCCYWWFQSLIFTGIWAMGHECGHGSFSKHRIINDSIGYIVHTFILTPYFSWKIIHHRHHMYHASMERDEVYVPATRSELGIPKETKDHPVDYEDYFGDTPIYTLFTLIRQQLIAFPYYLMTNVSGQRRYPKYTNHFNPNAVFFTKGQRNAVIASNIGIGAMLFALISAARHFGTKQLIMYYWIPYIGVTHWIIMITYLQHTDPHLPRFRNGMWNFQRGAAATIDRDFLGWMGRFFLHDVAHFHVVHHFFPKLPWYNGEEATRFLKQKIGSYYAHSDENSFKALWDNYNVCQFVEDEGDIVFFKDKKGRAVRRAATGCS